jgi:hypothetical protein
LRQHETSRDQDFEQHGHKRATKQDPLGKRAEGLFRKWQISTHSCAPARSARGRQGGNQSQVHRFERLSGLAPRREWIYQIGPGLDDFADFGIGIG